ncbi:MAG TPA: ABC transporter ATP-binding protein [Candidatus Hydrogenedentes bacterium]|nr:ABC transporter ATP-binding protein [Candidatus Hydrogenedentota bacterium]
MAIIDVDNVSKEYRLRGGPPALFRWGGARTLLGRRRHKTIKALEGITFAVGAGESLGIIGANGSGKSTLLKILAGVTTPTSGHVRLYGRVASLLELGAGFHPLLTGRENIYLNARILGMTHAEVDAAFDAIVAFSGIAEFIDDPINIYSSGMYLRIGFAVAAYADPEVFLVDEVFSIGDEAFQRKCRQRIGELKEQGKTIVFVSHDLGIVNALCDRVILLREGRMMAGESPQATIQRYLRQVEQTRALHAVCQGENEVVLAQGCLSLFHGEREVSGAAGLYVTIESSGRTYSSANDAWEVAERAPEAGAFRGRMASLPVVHDWRFRLDGDRLTWHIAIECERETTIEAFDANLMLRGGYVRWTYGRLAGPFPEILPGDLSWTVVVAPDAACREAGALPDEDSTLPPVLIELESETPYLRLQWSNTDYVNGGRLLQAGARLPEDARTFRPGRHELMTVSIRFDMTAGAVLERVRARRDEFTLERGAFSARFESGGVALAYGGAELTSPLRVYASILIGGLWNDSTGLQWHRIARSGGRVEASGESRRFPFRQHWELELADDGLRLAIWLETLEPIDIEEYHVSVGLRPVYVCWETDRESGVFPDIDPHQEDWRHVNRDYAPGARITATCKEFPSVALEVAADPTRVGVAPFRMTALNTDCHLNSRVLQALCTPGIGKLHFDKGRHSLFVGKVVVRQQSEQRQTD